MSKFATNKDVTSKQTNNPDGVEIPALLMALLVEITCPEKS